MRQGLRLLFRIFDAELLLRQGGQRGLVASSSRDVLSPRSTSDFSGEATGARIDSSFSKLLSAGYKKIASLTGLPFDSESLRGRLPLGGCCSFKAKEDEDDEAAACTG